MTFDPAVMLAQIQAALDALQRSIAHLAGLERAVIAFIDEHPQPVPSALVTTPQPTAEPSAAPATAIAPVKKAKAKTAPKPATAGPAARRTRPPDDEVLAVIATAKAERRPIAQAVADHYAVKVTTANNWITQARKAQPTTATASAPPASAPPAPATIASPADAAAGLKRAERPTAANQARAGSMMLTCHDCDFEAGSDRVADLNRHTLLEHGRRATSRERTPVPAEAAS